MTKKHNPWRKSPPGQKPPVDVNADVLRAILRINPELRGGDRSTEQVAEDLRSELPGGTPDGQAPLRRETRSLLGDEIEALHRRLGDEMAEVAVKRAQLDAREADLRASYLDSLVTLIGRYAPGPIGPEVRRLLDRHPELQRRLGAGVDEIERRILRLRGG